MILRSVAIVNRSFCNASCIARTCTLKRIDDRSWGDKELTALSARGGVLYASSYQAAVRNSFVSTFFPGYAIYSLRKLYATRRRKRKRSLLKIIKSPEANPQDYLHELAKRDNLIRSS